MCLFGLVCLGLLVFVCLIIGVCESVFRCFLFVWFVLCCLPVVIVIVCACLLCGVVV